jgi:hypothetical protein
MEIVYLAKKKSETKQVIISIREINKRKCTEARTVAVIKSTTSFLSKQKHKNLLQVWGMFWDEKKVCFIQEPAIRVASLTHVGGECILSLSVLYAPDPDFLAKFKWHQKVSDESDDRDEQYNRIMQTDMQAILIRQLVEYLKQMVGIYKYMLCEHEFKNLMVKPQTILETNGVLKLYDFALTSSLEAKNDDKEMWRKYCELFGD